MSDSPPPSASPPPASSAAPASRPVASPAPVASVAAAPALESTKGNPATSLRQGTSWVFFVFVGFLLGNGTGYLGGVVVGSRPRGPDAGGLDSEPTESPADLSRPRFLEGRGWSLSYPANWTLSATGSGQDPDHEVRIESPGDGSVQLSIRDAACDVNEELALHLVTYGTKVVEEGERGPLASWGRYPGRGVAVKGRLVGSGRGGVRVFAASVERRSFVAVETFAEEDEKTLEPGFRLIQESFTLK